MEVNTWEQVRCAQSVEDVVATLQKKFEGIEDWQLSLRNSAEILADSAEIFPQGIDTDVTTEIVILEQNKDQAPAEDKKVMVLVVREDGEESVISYPRTSPISSKPGEEHYSAIIEDLLEAVLDTIEQS